MTSVSQRLASEGLASVSPGLIIVKARRKDAKDMKACNERNLKENYNTDFWKTSVEYHHSYIVIDSSGIVVGYILALPHLILSFAIDARFRGQGWGRKLMEQYLKNNQHSPYVNLHVRVTNEIAVQLYKKLGFQIIDEIKDYYRNPIENGYLMKMNK